MLLLTACGEDRPGGPDVFPPTATIRIEARSGTWDVLVEVAATSEARKRGLMKRAYLPEDRGMLFFYREEQVLGFWMKDCPVPIDVAYVDEDGRIVNIARMQPEPGVSMPRSYPSLEAVRIVLEMSGGWFRDRGIEAGDRVVLPDDLLRLRPE